MATRKAFYEELERYGIDISDISRIKIEKGSSVLIYVNEKRVRIKEPYIVKLAKLATLNIPLDSELTREQLLKRLYGIITVFKGESMRFSEFKRQKAKLSTEEIGKRLEELEKKYSVAEQTKIYRGGLEIRIYKKLVENFGLSFRDFEEEIIKESCPTTENLLNVLAELYR
ncbi:MAG: hypothetical protein QMD14_01515 [Candidatus Aenigmarchaeota archaeon]|nr:hypothetical protein [Candidatus Aenigmarchaeota archaeon]